MQQFDFSGKVVLVTGAYQGIGAAIASTFVELGARVIGLDKKFDGATTSGNCRYLDLADEKCIAKVCNDLLTEEPRIDVLVNAAGILHMGNVESLSSQAWQESFAVNVTGPFHLLQQLIPRFKQQKAGTIVIVGSNATHAPRPQMVAYSAAKAALANLSKTVALELAPFGVRCNIVSPGSTDTPMQRSMWRSSDDSERVIAGDPSTYRLGIPLGKMATPTDIANLVVFLASDLAGHLVLQDIVVDGGATLGA